jgi:hypothetical protein
MRDRFLIAAALALLAIPAFAAAAKATPVFELRVESTQGTLEPGTFYASRRGGIPAGQETAAGSCARGSGRHVIPGRTAMSLLGAAARASASLRPVWVVEDEFGRRVCRVDRFLERDTPFTGWLFRVNHEAPPMAADLSELGRGDQVLWVFANFGTGENTGDELVLRAPVRAQPGPVDVRVGAFAFDGSKAPAPDGTVVTGGASPATTVGGVATVTLTPGTQVLRAVGPGSAPDEIPSNRLSACAATQVEDCPATRGRRVVGSNRADRLRGRGGPDRIRSRGGRDRIYVRGGGSDRVDCGKGRDRVIADAGDVLRRCERRSIGT